MTEAGQADQMTTFLKAHWKALAASDFLTAEAWTGRGWMTHYLLFVTSLADRVVDVFGVTTKNLTRHGFSNIGYNLIDSEEVRCAGNFILIIDRDAKYTDQFRRLVGEIWDETIKQATMVPVSPLLRKNVNSKR